MRRGIGALGSSTAPTGRRIIASAAAPTARSKNCRRWSFIIVPANVRLGYIKFAGGRMRNAVTPAREAKAMASIEKFNDHCWKDVIPESDLKLYAGWRRETFVGARPALLAIDLYDLVYRGGPLPPSEINDRHVNTCGIYAHRAIAPTKKLLAAARRAGIPIFFCTQEMRPNNRPRGAVSTRRTISVPE